MQPDPLFSLPWWRSIHHRWQKKRYAGTEFAPLFDTPPDNEWVSLDCETTGLNVKSDHLLSIGAVRIAGQRILSSDPAVYWPAARAWSRFEGRRVYLMPQPEDAEKKDDTEELIP